MQEHPQPPRCETLFDKVWAQHVVHELDDGRTLLRIDRHMIHDGSSRQAFDGLRKRKLGFHDLSQSIAVSDHIVSTMPGRTTDSYEPAKERLYALRANATEFDVRFYDVTDRRQGIVHVISPELGFTVPGSTIVCGDSHTATNGALGALAWGIGTTEVMHVMATQTLLMRKPRTLKVDFAGRLPPGISAKDMILGFISRFGVEVGRGYAVEYSGSAVRDLAMEGRMTICNMSIELGARMGMIAVDEETIEYLRGRPFVPSGQEWDKAVAHWRTLRTDADAPFDLELTFDCSDLRPQISWGTSPEDVIDIDQVVPDPTHTGDPEKRAAMERMLAYMDLQPGKPLAGTPIQYAFIGSCTNSRLSDLEVAADVVRGRRVANGVSALVVPGSMSVKAAAEKKGLDKVFLDAGFEWRSAGCSMCVASNGDLVPAGARAISTTNRNFEHRQGRMSRTHLASPASVAAAAVIGCITDVRQLLIKADN